MHRIDKTIEEVVIDFEIMKLEVTVEIEAKIE